MSENPTARTFTCPNPVNLKRTANRTRQSKRPPELADLDFEVATHFLPADFFQKDVRVGSAHHLIFYTPDQLELLDRAKTWYLDGTFKLVKQPLCQLFCVHAFIKGNAGELKQVPLAFAMMSRRTKKDYKKVLKALKKKLPSQATNVREMVVDFESDLWSAIRAIFDVDIKGCLYHWTQAVWRKCQELGQASTSSPPSTEWRRQQSTLLSSTSATTSGRHGWKAPSGGLKTGPYSCGASVLTTMWRGGTAESMGGRVDTT
ncbi:uncharacterized protein LOC119727820 [Patiria miniata]|uniref:MULE transposase domain-containing protein n=1 Tax=Patiria miniata TaxID=46514 RepID=A0A913ZXP1_PATMI|nr:uncharacterized protein LOC119727820 [Patiria miniata]